MRDVLLILGSLGDQFLLGALLLGMLVGYERSYHGWAAGMRTFGLVCMASAGVIVFVGFAPFWYGGSTEQVSSNLRKANSPRTPEPRLRRVSSQPAPLTDIPTLPPRPRRRDSPRESGPSRHSRIWIGSRPSRLDIAPSGSLIALPFDSAATVPPPAS